MKTETFVLASGEEIPIIFNTKSGVRNIVLRPKVSPTRELHITLPRLVSHARAMKFVAEKQRWLEKIFARAPEKIKLKSGDIITVFGKETLLTNNKSETQHAIIVGGSPEFFERRVRDEIKKQFLARVKCEIAAAPREFRPARIAVRDTTSRWGSCSASGTISFSYRLAFAPPAVMRYVILHELAHRKHMDHSPDFWRLVSELYGPGVERAKLWLSKNGQSLHKYF
ncbi:MAG: M48 family metallopeptidase [Alphaproteobacteria bacterium]|nr:M48 family metallopeptidase [Alphaproteobacteria bacterium]MCL2890204.1 M48 family metallopeptidase [Alphaproteobacteria bacterium]